MMGNSKINRLTNPDMLDAEKVRSLTRAWLDGSLSPEEELTLEELCLHEDFSSWEERPDDETLSTLRLIATLGRHRSETLNSAAVAIPTEVDKMLDTHIHTLAQATASEEANSRHNFRLRLPAIRKITAAAAVAALLATAVWRIGISSDPLPSANVHPQIALTDSPAEVIPEEHIENMPPPESSKHMTQSRPSDDSERLRSAHHPRVLNHSKHSEETKHSRESEFSGNSLSAGLSESVELTEEMEEIMRKLDENFSYALEFSSEGTDKLSADLLTVDRVLNNVEDDLEATTKSVESLLDARQQYQQPLPPRELPPMIIHEKIIPLTKAIPAHPFAPEDF